MNALPRDYDAWRLSGPDDESDAIGIEEHEVCNRLSEPDEDAPRNWRPRPCGGSMIEDGGVVICEACGALA